MKHILEEKVLFYRVIVRTFWMTLVSGGTGKIKIFKCRQILINPLHKGQKYPGIRERHPPVIAV